MLPVCESCHGPGGVSVIPSIPSLAGQHEGFLFGRLKDYQGPLGNSEVMRAMIGQLTEADLRALADHYTVQAYVRNRQAADPERAARGRLVYQRLCSLCHLYGGRASAYAEYPLLAGQSLDYMLTTVDDIMKHSRAVGELKRQILGWASRHQVEDAIHFFADQEVNPGEVGSTVRKPPSLKKRLRLTKSP